MFTNDSSHSSMCWIRERLIRGAMLEFAALLVPILPFATAQQPAGPGCSSGQVLYAVTPNTLYRIDNYATAPSAVALASVSVGFWDLAVHPQTGVLYGVTPGTTSEWLFTLDPSTGIETFVGDVGTPDYVNALDFDALGVLYGRGSSGGYGAYVIDTTTGAATLIGITGSPSAGDLAVAFDGTIYSTNTNGLNSELQTIDTSSGVATTVATINVPGEVWGLEIDNDGTMYGTINTEFYRIDPVTGVATLLGSFPEIPYGLAFVCPAGTSGTSTFCTAGTTTHACNATIAGTGTPSASMISGFTITVDAVEGLKQGILFYGINNSGYTPTPWGPRSSYLCVKHPTQRMGSLSSGGTFNNCDGVLAVDWNAYIATHSSALGNPFAAGQHVFAQGWFRDPPSPKTTMLSNGLEFVVQP